MRLPDDCDPKTLRAVAEWVREALRIGYLVPAATIPALLHKHATRIEKARKP